MSSSLEQDNQIGYELHFFICTTKREGKPCCGEKGSDQLRQQIKNYCKEKYGNKVRINISGCLDYCSSGIAAVSYPENKWFLKLTKDSYLEMIQYIDHKMKNKS